MAGLWAGVGMRSALVAGALAVPALFGDRIPAQPVVATASRSSLLDQFSSTARPLAVHYDPFAVTSADAMLSLVHFVATPGLRRDPQPVPVLLNMRLSLPAGRYRVSLTFTVLPPGEHTLGLRIGRIGAIYRVFDVPASGATWQGEFDLPIDANFVGFEASMGLAAAVTRVEVTPIAVVEAARRLVVGQVLSARSYPGGDLFGHDEQAWLEAEGVWTAGKRAASLTFVPRAGTTPMVRLYTGPRPNTVLLAGAGWQRSIEVAAQQRVDVVLPVADASRPIALTVLTREGFSPSDLDPAGKDLRFVGAYLVFP